jgi:hypothetical protein
LVEVEVVLGIVGALVGLWLVSVGSHGGLELVIGVEVALSEGVSMVKGRYVEL